MEHVNTLRDYGLFDASVPRYTSYPPANRFEPDVGAKVQDGWLSAVPMAEPVSVYVHIPFCRRLCWFCACRTQGTRTLEPVASYVETLVTEIELVTSRMSMRPRMARLHLGGGTPTLLPAGQMTRLLDAIDVAFEWTPDCEFSVEIDPTDAPPETLDVLAGHRMKRASIGVQDFALRVQEAIGRQQSFAQTKAVVDQLRAGGVRSLNIDLLYGLPHQTLDTLAETLDQVHTLGPDRLALYGYAHVPHMSKRQSMIPADALPNALARFEAAQMAKARLEALGYVAIGIDHFARPSDSLAKAAAAGRLRRNFQGYTDDPCATLLGFGASAISKFPEGYIQNAVATSAYQKRVRAGVLGGHKGYVMTPKDAVISKLIDSIMCKGAIDGAALIRAHPAQAGEIVAVLSELARAYPKALRRRGEHVALRPGMEALARVIAAHMDTALQRHHVHSAAI